MLETRSLRFEKNTHKGCKIAGQNKVFFSSANLGLINHYSSREGLKKNGGKCDLFRTRVRGGGWGGGQRSNSLGDFFAAKKTFVT